MLPRTGGVVVGSWLQRSGIRPLQRLGVKRAAGRCRSCAAPDDSEEQSVVYRQQRLIVAAEW
ncbi:unnamed protein product [Ectocarpus sp. CCAP 1310/34]|nr:unnamed protein product [Ectocarpus sp. CCAP 1310/34]